VKIKKIHSREILSSSGSPTIETSVFLADGTEGRASVPYGVSSGKYEAVTLSDNDPNRFIGMGMLKAVRVVNEIIRPGGTTHHSHAFVRYAPPLRAK